MVRLAETMGYSLPWANLVDACVGLASANELRWAIQDLQEAGVVDVTPQGLRFALKEPRVIPPASTRDPSKENQ
jgi:hypothetical protein